MDQTVLSKKDRFFRESQPTLRIRSSSFVLYSAKTASLTDQPLLPLPIQPVQLALKEHSDLYLRIRKEACSDLRAYKIAYFHSDTFKRVREIVLHDLRREGYENEEMKILLRENIRWEDEERERLRRGMRCWWDEED